MLHQISVGNEKRLHLIFSFECSSVKADTSSYTYLGVTDKATETLKKRTDNPLFQLFCYVEAHFYIAKVQSCIGTCKA